MAVTHQYYQNRMQESASKGKFSTLVLKGILLGYMATNQQQKENR